MTTYHVKEIHLSCSKIGIENQGFSRAISAPIFRNIYYFYSAFVCLDKRSWIGKFQVFAKYLYGKYDYVLQASINLEKLAKNNFLYIEIPEKKIYLSSNDYNYKNWK